MYFYLLLKPETMLLLSESIMSLFILYNYFFLLFSSEEHQFQLVKCGGLPLIITFLTEDSNEEVRKVATFLLQTCKQASKSKLLFLNVMHLPNRNLNSMLLYFKLTIVMFKKKKNNWIQKNIRNEHKNYFKILKIFLFIRAKTVIVPDYKASAV